MRKGGCRGDGDASATRIEAKKGVPQVVQEPNIDRHSACPDRGSGLHRSDAPGICVSRSSRETLVPLKHIKTDTSDREIIVIGISWGSSR